MLVLHAIKGPTGRLLAEMLKEKGLIGKPVKGVVNYGYAENLGLPTLNANAGHLNKYQELVTLDQDGVTTIPFSGSAADLQAPIFGRKFHHTRANDIFAYKAKPLLRGDRLADYYTEVISKDKEYRVWVFRDKALATYEKVLKYADKYGRRGRNKEVWNWENGFAYQFVHPEESPAKLRKLAIKAVEALDLDFGAVDLIHGKDGHYYVLEVNTAPGVEERRQGITSLVNCIERWAKGGFPGRN